MKWKGAGWLAGCCWRRSGPLYTWPMQMQPQLLSFLPTNQRQKYHLVIDSGIWIIIVLYELIFLVTKGKDKKKKTTKRGTITSKNTLLNTSANNRCYIPVGGSSTISFRRVFHNRVFHNLKTRFAFSPFLFLQGNRHKYLFHRNYTLYGPLIAEWCVENLYNTSLFCIPPNPTGPGLVIALPST